MARKASSLKWDSILRSQSSLEADDNSRFIVFLGIGDVLGTSPPPDKANGDRPICWIRARLVDATGQPFEDKSGWAETKPTVFSSVPNFGMVPMMLGDVQRIAVSIASLEDTFLRVEFIWEKQPVSGPAEEVVVGGDDLSLFLLSPIGDAFDHRVALGRSRGDGTRQVVGEAVAKLRLKRTALSAERLAICRDIFRNFDKDGGGFIDHIELQHSLQNLGYPCTENQV